MRATVAAAVATLHCCSGIAEASAVPNELLRVRVDPESGLLRDSSGRARIFHGTNVVFKEPPWYPPSDKFDPLDSLDGETMDLMRKWGFNVVRLGVMWPGVEPKPGEIDSAYLAEVLRLSKELAKRGTYTLVDLHQDLGSRRFCGEGFPEHYVDALLDDPTSALSQAPDFPHPIHPKLTVDSAGKPFLQDCLKNNFGDYYISEKVGALFSALYTPDTQLNQGFMKYWGNVSKTFVGQPHVMGYELLNEPSGYCLGGGSWSCAGSVKLLGNDVERNQLMPLFNAAAKVIRAVDPDTPLFYEATLTPKPLSDAFPDLAIDNDPQQGLAYHVYCPPGDQEGFTQGWVCDRTQETFTGLYYKFLHKHKSIAGFMTEFGAIQGSPGEIRHTDRLLNFADGELQSWAFWQMKKFRDFTTANAGESFYDEHGALNIPKLKVLTRTYAQAIAGTPREMSFDLGTATFKLGFTATLKEVPTEIYLNEELHYPEGYSVEVEPAGCLSQKKEEDNYIKFFLTEEGSCLNSLVTITITSKGSAAAGELVV